jgi:hypothetical protein
VPASFGHRPRSGSLADEWSEVLGLIGERLGNGTAGLLNGSVPSETASDTVTIELPAGAVMQRQMCQTNGRREQIAQVLSDYLGRSVRLELRTAASETPDQQANAPSSTQRRYELLGDPAVKTVLAELRATVTNIEETSSPAT